MPPSNEEVSDSDSDDGFSEDMAALTRACQLTGKSPFGDKLQLSSTTTAASANGGDGEGASSEAESDEEGDDELKLVQCIQKRFAGTTDMEDEPLKMKPLCTMPPDWSDIDDCEDDYETLRAIQRRFTAFNDGGLKDNVEDPLHRPVQVGATIIDSEKETSNNFVERTNVREGFLNCVDSVEPVTKSEACGDAGGRQPNDLDEWDGPCDDNVVGLPFKAFNFPKSALAFVDAIRKNRSCQKLIRSKMVQMEARIEELNKLIERVKILKDFQVACKKRTGRALSLKKDARVQLISVPKTRTNVKFSEKKIPALYKGPSENPHVASYKEAMATFVAPVCRENWSKEERENLVKGVKQQFQGMLLQRSLDLLREADGSFDSGNVDSIIESIKDVDITPEKLRLFLPKVNWEQLASMYVPGRSGAECQARFLNHEDPLINHSPWITMEDKNLLHILQQKGLSDWIDIAASLGTNRTPFQCLARYQRSLNASILKREWTKEEDNQLRAAVESYGESNWQVVASTMEGRAGTQCSNRWLKTLHPARKRVGKWTADEDKRLKVAVTLFGPKTWKKIAACVPGRTQVQCRERWVNCLDPSLNMAEWTEEEDLKLEEAIAEHGYCWSKVAACIPPRTDNQCRRRWKTLFPTEVPRLQAARKIQKVALISNFVDRESERPALGPSDFRVPETHLITASEVVDPSRRKRTRSMRRKAHEFEDEDAHSGEISTEEISRNSNGEGVRKSKANNSNSKRRCRSKKKKLGSKSEFSDATNTSSAAISIEPNMNENEHSDPSRCNLEDVLVGPERGGDDAPPGRKASKLQPRRRNSKRIEEETESTPLVNTLAVSKRKTKREKKNIGTINDHLSSRPELGGDDAPQGGKASKVQPRRRNSKRIEEEAESVPQVNTLAVSKRKMTRRKKNIGPINDHLSSCNDSMPLMDSGEAIEADPRVKSKKRKRKNQETRSRNDSAASPDSNSRSDIKDAVTGCLDGSALSDRESDLQPKGNTIALTETGEENMTLDRADLASTKLSSTGDGISVPNQLKRQRSRDRTRLNLTMEVEAGDDMTLADFYNSLKRRRTEASLDTTTTSVGGVQSLPEK